MFSSVTDLKGEAAQSQAPENFKRRWNFIIDVKLSLKLV